MERQTVSEKCDISGLPLNKYIPVKAGFEINIRDGKESSIDKDCGTAETNPRNHRRPLFPPADKSLIWDEGQLEKLERCCFRPLALAYNEPRFILDFHSAGGLLGHLYIGLASENKQAGKWFHQWEQITVTYTEGRLEYLLKDPEYPGTVVKLSVSPLAGSVGLIIKLGVDGIKDGYSFVCAYGGASGFFTPYFFTLPAFTFSSKQCKSNKINIYDRSFTLIKDFSDPDPDFADYYMKDLNSAARHIEGWKAVIKGGGSKSGRCGYGDADAMLDSPAALLNTAVWSSSEEKCAPEGHVALYSIFPDNKTGDIYFAAGMGKNMDSVLEDLELSWYMALDRNRDIAERIVVSSPDTYLDAAVQMLCFSTEGIWGGNSVLHGGWSWRYSYLGWRGWYGPACCGWLDRVRKSIETHTKIGLIREGDDKGALTSVIENEPYGVYYNMNEVFFDHVRQYFDYTNDIGLMKEIFPVLESIVEWENRRLRPNEEYLYESCLNTWISDSHWYIKGQCTQASSYMMMAYRLLADIARRIGADDSQYERASGLIFKALQEKLWLKREGVFAEYLDTVDSRLLHPEPELPTIYHSIEFGAADPFQTYQMLFWVDNNLKIETTSNGGNLYWSSNWFPNAGRSYTHSTYEMATGENLNLALAYYTAGRKEEAFKILKGILYGIFNGPTPGGLSCHIDITGKQRSSDEFADAISMWSRAVAEGLFGIKPKKQDNYIELIPQFPEEWDRASINTRQISYEWESKADIVSIRWETGESTEIHFRIPLVAEQIKSVSIDALPVKFSVEAGVGLSWININSGEKNRGILDIKYEPLKAEEVKIQITAVYGGTVCYKLPEAKITDIYDPQGLIAGARIDEGVLEGVAAGKPGKGVLFLKGGTTQCPVWIPAAISIIDPVPVERKAWMPSQFKCISPDSWKLIDLKGIYNASSPIEAIKRVSDAAVPSELPASDVGFGYRRVHYIEWCIKKDNRPSDTAWRKKVGNDGVAWTRDGIPFKTDKHGNNLGVVTLVGGYPKSLEFSAGDKGRKLFLMVSGMTFPNQSHVVNLRVTLRYRDNEVEVKDLVNPFDIGDCWGVWCGRFHDTAANGFENLGGRFGPSGSAEVDDLKKPVEVDTEAHLLEFILRDGVELSTVRIEAVANDIIFGIMGATILK